MSSQLKAPDQSMHPKVLTTLETTEKGSGHKGLERQVTTFKTNISVLGGVMCGREGREKGKNLRTASAFSSGKIQNQITIKIERDFS